MDQGCITGGVFLDLCKAFDSVADHSILKLRNLPMLVMTLYKRKLNRACVSLLIQHLPNYSSLPVYGYLLHIKQTTF